MSCLIHVRRGYFLVLRLAIVVSFRRLQWPSPIKILEGQRRQDRWLRFLLARCNKCVEGWWPAIRSAWIERHAIKQRNDGVMFKGVCSTEIIPPTRRSNETSAKDETNTNGNDASVECNVDASVECDVEEQEANNNIFSCFVISELN